MSKNPPPVDLAPRAPLGTPAKSSSIGHQQGFAVDPETGEVLPGRGLARLERFALQAAARRALPDSRTARCLRWTTGAGEVGVLKSIAHGTCIYNGLQTCGSVWACPVCAGKISERRRVELVRGIELHQAAGGQALLLTLTTPHYLADNLAVVLERQAKALKYFNGGRAAQAAAVDMGLVGQVRALEVTHGRMREVNNGWHPHYHVLLFVRAGLDLEAWRVRIFERWAKACERAGLKAPSLKHGVSLEDGSKAANYASKWGLDAEMTKGHIKRAIDGETPFDLLRAYLGGDEAAASFFAEFTQAFRGKRQLYWSPGLKARFELEDLDDEELASGADDRALLLGTITLEQWRAVLRFNARCLVLELAEKQGWSEVERYLVALSQKGVGHGCDEHGCVEPGQRLGGVELEQDADVGGRGARPRGGAGDGARRVRRRPGGAPAGDAGEALDGGLPGRYRACSRGV